MATAAEIDVENLEPFGRCRKEVATLYDGFLDSVNEHFDWLHEVYDEARQIFQKDEVELLPTTPSERRKRGRQRNGGVQKRQSSAVKRRTGSGRKSRNRSEYQKVYLGIAAVVGDQGSSTLELPEEKEAQEVQYDVQALVISEENGTDPDPDPVDDAVNVQTEDGAVVADENVLVQETDDDVQSANQRMEEGNADGGSQVNVHHEGIDDGEQNVHIPAEEEHDVVADLPEQPGAKGGSFNEKESGSEPASGSQLLKAEGQKDYSTPSAERKLYLGLASSTSKSHLPIPISASRERLTPSAALTPRITPTHPMKPSIRTPQTSVMKKENYSEMRTRMNERLEDAEAKKTEFLKQRIELTKQKREEHIRRVYQKRLLQRAVEEEHKRTIEKKYNTPSGADLDEKRKLRPKYFESGTKRPDNERTQMQERENEKVEEAERIRREQREMERLAQLERERQKLPPAGHSAVKQGDLKTAMIGHQHLPATKPKYPETFEEPKDTSMVRVVIPKKHSNRGGLNASNAGASTSSKQNATASAAALESYAMTPLRDMKPATDTNYDISDLRSSDETDDEEHPRKQIPAWAKGGALRFALTQQFYAPIDLDDLFGIAHMPDLSQIFKFKRKRFEKRTSSAKWDSPIRPHAAE